MRKVVPLVTSLVFLPILVALFLSSPIFAYSPSDFQPGRIADDNTFFDPYGLSVEQIQNFLSAKVPVCDTWHAPTNVNYQPPYTCLKDFRQETWSIPGDAFCKGFSTGNKSAAQIIYEVGVSCGISQKVILVTLQKEQSFITDTWPWPTQYTKAMGYGCPDSDLPYAVDQNNNNCYDEYEGFFKQVYYGARQFKRYALEPDTFPSYRPFRTKYIQYNPSTSCGGSNVYIQNQATAGLYTYTPYQPNAGSLNHKLSGGRYYDTSYPDCGAYGNINFWLLFSNWFGSPLDGVMVTSPLKMTSEIPEGSFTQRRITFSFDVQNYTPWDYGIGDMLIAVRDSQGRNYDFGRKQVLLGPKGTYRYSASTVLNTEETYTFWITNFRSSTGWSDNFPVSSTDTLSRKINGVFVQALPTVIEQPRVVNEFRLGRTDTLSFKIKNNSAQPINLGKIGLSVRDPAGKNRDPGYDTVVSLAPGAVHAYQKSFTPVLTGKHSIDVALTLNNGASWSGGLFPGVAPGVSRSVVLDAKPNPTVTSGVTASDPTNLRVGKVSTLSFHIKNHGSSAVTLEKIGLIVRDPSGINRDPRWDNVTIQPGDTYTYSVPFTFSKAGNWQISIGGFKSDLGGWNSVYPSSEDNGVARSITASVKPNPTVTSGLQLSGTLKINQANTVSFTVKNHGSNAIKVERLGISVRDPSGINRDPRWDNVTIQPGDTYTYSVPFTFSKAGKWSISISSYQPDIGGWNTVYPSSEDNGILRKVDPVIN